MFALKAAIGSPLTDKPANFELVLAARTNFILYVVVLLPSSARTVMVVGAPSISPLVMVISLPLSVLPAKFAVVPAALVSVPIPRFASIFGRVVAL